MNFKELVSIFENESTFVKTHDDGVTFKRGDIPGGPILFGDQKLDIDRDISIEVRCHGRTGFDNTLVIVPKTKKAKAARIKARRNFLSEDFPKEVYDRSVIVSYGWELVLLLDDHYDDLEKLLKVKNRPDTNIHGYLSKDRFDDWLDFNEFDQESWLRRLSGPREESLLEILYGDWFKLPSIEKLIWNKYVIN